MLKRAKMGHERAKTGHERVVGPDPTRVARGTWGPTPGLPHEESVDAGPTGYPAREREDLVQLGFFPYNLSSRSIK